MMNTYPVYSAQSYVYEPPDLWEKEIDEQFRNRAPRVATLNGIKQWVVEDNVPMTVTGEIEDAVIYSDYLDPDAYIRALDREGITGAVLYPTVAHRGYGCLDKELLSAVVRIYNDWIVEYCSTHPQRLKAIAMLNVDDPDEAVAELERAATMGAVGAMIPLFAHTQERYDNPKYEKLWTAAENLNLPISLVSNTLRSPQKLPSTPKLSLANLFDLLPLNINNNDILYRFTYQTCEVIYPRIAIASMILSGVFSRYPSLRIVTVGFGAAWAPYFMTRTDEMYEVRPERAGSEVDKNSSDPYELISEHAGFHFSEGQRPSDQVRSNVYFTFEDEDDLTDFNSLKLLGLNSLLWGSAYLHKELTFGSTREMIENQLAQITDSERTLLLERTTAALYGF
jgi:uncharacterized protein